MMFLLRATAMFIPGFVRVGGVHVPVYGIFAALGLIAALWLSQRTALKVGLSANALWDAGVFAVIAAFVASRTLLVAFDLQAFLKFPLLVLALPSLTYGGMALTGLMVWGWLRWKRMPVRDALDAWAPCGALLAAVLSVAHFVEGTDAGMPTSLPWGVVTPGDTVLGRVHPVQIYSAVFAVFFAVRWFRALSTRRYPGQIGTSALIMGGLLTFFLDMLCQPMKSQGNALLDPGQYVALFSLIAGFLMLAFLYVPIPPPTRAEVATILEDFVLGRSKTGVAHEAVEYGKFNDPLLIEIQETVYFGALNEKEQQQMLQYAQRLRENPNEQESELN
jgi:phosphatidylglycerol---prolipoprotein diacylglyceryl transferase